MCTSDFCSLGAGDDVACDGALPQTPSGYSIPPFYFLYFLVYSPLLSRGFSTKVRYIETILPRTISILTPEVFDNGLKTQISIAEGRPLT